MLNTTTLTSENTYEYTNTNWEDQLTKFNNTVVTYDAIGNPLTIGDTHLTWINGRQLNSYQDSHYTINYKYNDNGIRTKKIVNNVEVDYHLEGSRIIFEQRGNNVLYYMYSEADELIGFEYNNVPYYYLKNNQNDIIGIMDANKNVLAKYTYDSWGKLFL